MIIQGDCSAEERNQLTYSTLPMLFKQRYEEYGDKEVCMRCKRLGIWQEYNWKHCYGQIKYTSLAMVGLGAEFGDKVAIIGNNDPEYFWVEYGAMALGGTIVGLHSQATPEEIRYIVEHSDTKFMFAEGREQIDKLLFLKEQGHIPLVKGIFYWNPKDIWGYEDSMLYSFDEMLEMGRKFEKEHTDSFEQNLEKIKPEDICLCFYTSGTTDLPKGVMVSHQQLLSNAVVIMAIDRWHDTDNIVSCMPPTWMMEQVVSVATALLSSTVINFAGGPETIDEDIREIGPNILFYDAEQWENMTSRIHARIDTSSDLGRFACHWALNVGYKRAQMEEQGQKPSFFWKALHAIAFWIVFRSILDKFGLLNIRTAWTTGSILTSRSFNFIRAIGVPLRQIYGSTEMAITTLHKHRIKPESVGEVFDGGEVKVGPNNEILGRGPNLFTGYYKSPEAMARAIDKDGWFHSGDVGFFDPDNQLIYMGRVEEFLKLPDGSKFSLQHIERDLKLSPQIKECMAVGGKNRSYITVLINIDFSVVSKWAEAHHISHTTFAEVAQSPQVYELMAKDIEQVNQRLPECVKIKKFALLPREFDPDEAELTRTHKLRRQFVEKKYQRLINGLYTDVKEVIEQTEITYGDGRKSTVPTPVKIWFMEETR